MHHIKMTSTFQFLQSIFNAPPMPLVSIAHKNLVTILTLLVVFISMCTVYILHYYFVIIHSIKICMSIVIFIIL